MALNPFSDIGGFVGSVAGDFWTEEERRKQLESIERQRQLYEDLPTRLKAEQEGLTDLGPSAFESFREDPAMRQEQLRTLAALRDIGTSGGLDPQARSALAEAQAATAEQERGQRGAILDQFARGGGRHSNSALLAALTAQQGSAQRAGMEGLRTAGDAQARQYRALMDAGALAGGVRGQDYGVASDRLGAMDRVSAYNAQNRQQVAARNTDRRSSTNEGNIGRQYQRAGMIGGTYGDERGYWEQQERRKRALAAGGGQAAGSAVGYAVGPKPPGMP